LRDLIDELQGKPALVLFYFRDEGLALSKLLGAPRVDGTTTQTEFNKIVPKWNAGDLPVLLGQPAAMGHGLNLQHGGNDVIWFTLTDNQDDYYQTNRRIYRQGVKGNQVRIHRLIADDTVDTAVLKSLESKTKTQKALLDAIRDLRVGGRVGTALMSEAIADAVSVFMGGDETPSELEGIVESLIDKGSLPDSLESINRLRAKVGGE
jgi:hypothetical protein